MADKIRLHNMILHTKVLGPGIRCAIWLQGCQKRCKGCMSPSSRALDGGKLVDIKSVEDAIIQAGDIEGITVSGGEPFLQVDALHSLLKFVKNETNLSVIVYSGYTLSELKAEKSPLIHELLSKYIDVLIDGEYVDELNKGKSLVGSENQTVHFLSDRYINCRELYDSNTRDVEIFATGNEFLFVGIPDKETYQKWTHTTDTALSDWKKIN